MEKLEKKQKHLDRMLAESVRLRTVLETAAKELKNFSEELSEASRALREELQAFSDPSPGRENHGKDPEHDKDPE